MYSDFPAAQNFDCHVLNDNTRLQVNENGKVDTNVTIAALIRRY
jgi:hypothetical protein